MFNLNRDKILSFGLGLLVMWFCTPQEEPVVIASNCPPVTVEDLYSAQEGGDLTVAEDGIGVELLPTENKVETPVKEEKTTDDVPKDTSPHYPPEGDPPGTGEEGTDSKDTSKTEESEDDEKDDDVIWTPLPEEEAVIVDVSSNETIPEPTGIPGYGSENLTSPEVSPPTTVRGETENTTVLPGSGGSNTGALHLSFPRYVKP